MRRISSKIILALTIILAVGLGLGAAAISYFTSDYLEQNARDSMRDTARLADNVLHRDIEQAALFSKLIAGNYQVQVTMEARRKGRRISTRDTRQSLRREMQSVSADFISLAGADGVVFLHQARSKIKPADMTVLENEPMFLSRVFQECVTENRQAVGIEPVYPNSLAVVAVAPVVVDDDALGFVRLGYRLDQRFISQVSDITHTHVAVLHRGKPVAATLPSLISQNSEQSPDPLAAVRRSYLIYSTPLVSGERQVAQLLTTYPRSKITGLRHRITMVIAGVALIAFAASVLAGTRLAALIVRPLRDLMAGVRRLESGDLNTSIPEHGRDESGRLARSFNRMTDSLRARDEEIRRNQDQLIESGKLAAIGELAAGVAHEIGNPLAAISGYIQLLKDAQSPEKTRHFLEEMEKEVGFIDATIRELLDFSRPARSEEQTVALNDAADECLRMLSFHKAMRGVRVSNTTDSANPTVLGSRKELLQAMLNLCLNGAQAMPQGGDLELRISTQPEDVPSDHAGIFISDTGSGIARENLGKIFDPFFTTKRGGTGLGLSITYRIIQRHQGELSVDTEPGKGATFKILLPLLNRDNPGQAREESAAQHKDDTPSE